MPTSSIHSAGASPMMLQPHGISHWTLPEGKLGLGLDLVSKQSPWLPTADQPGPILSNYAERSAGTSDQMVWQGPQHDPVETRRSAKRRYERSRRGRPQHPWPWLVASRDGTTSPTRNYDINGYHFISCNNNHNLWAHLKVDEHSGQKQAAAPVMGSSPASVFSTNSTDSGYMSALDGVPLTFPPTQTPDLNAMTSPLLTEDILLKCCGMPSTTTQLECDETTTSSDAYLADRLIDGIGFTEGRAQTTRYINPLFCSPAMALTGR